MPVPHAPSASAAYLCSVTVCATPPRPIFFTDPATTEIYPLSLHDALPISRAGDLGRVACIPRCAVRFEDGERIVRHLQDRKSTRLNSSHLGISYAVFCLKKNKRLTQVTKE